jgi:tripartite-type tricarboxylate transporter receptor subunit TctC
MPRHLPGTPTIVVRNQPGAGSGTAAAAIYRTAPKDGTWIGAIFPGVIMHPILDPGSPLQFQPREFHFLGSADNSTRVCITHEKSQTRTMENAVQRKTVMGASAAGGSTRDYAFMLNNIAGTKFDVVSGYKGTVDIFLAMERGEVDGMCGIDWASLRSQRPNWISDNKINILVETALEPTPELVERGVPIVWKYVKDAKDREAAELIVSQQIFGRPFIAPPQTPANVVKILRQGFMDAVADPEYLADAKKGRINVDPVAGEKVQALVERPLQGAGRHRGTRARDHQAITVLKR